MSSKQPLNKNAARKKVVSTATVEEKTIEEPKVEVPKIDVEKAQQENDMEIMSISESVKEKLPLLGVGFVLLLMAISMIGHYYSLIFG